VTSEAQARDAGNYVTPTGSSLATDDLAAFVSGSLFCLADVARHRVLNVPRHRRTADRLGAMTGKSSLDEGAKVTQGASLLPLPALGKARTARGRTIELLGVRD